MMAINQIVGVYIIYPWYSIIFPWEKEITLLNPSPQVFRPRSTSRFNPPILVFLLIHSQRRSLLRVRWGERGEVAPLKKVDKSMGQEKNVNLLRILGIFFWGIGKWYSWNIFWIWIHYMCSIWCFKYTVFWFCHFYASQVARQNFRHQHYCWVLMIWEFPIHAMCFCCDFAFRVFQLVNADQMIVLSFVWGFFGGEKTPRVLVDSAIVSCFNHFQHNVNVNGLNPQCCFITVSHLIACFSFIFLGYLLNETWEAFRSWYGCSPILSSCGFLIPFSISFTHSPSG